MIKQFQVANYKSLGNLDVNLDPVTVLIGKSGTGKTNFVESLRFLRDYIQSPHHSAFAQPGWPRVLSATAARPLSLSFTVRFDAPGIPGEFVYRLVLRQPSGQLHQESPPALSEESLELGKRVLFSQRGGKWEDPPALVSPPQPNSVMLGAITGIREVSVAHRALTDAIAYYAFGDDVLLGGQAVLQNPQARTKQFGLRDDAKNYLEAIEAILGNLNEYHRWNEMLAALAQLNQTIKSIDVAAPQRISIIVSHDVGGRFLTLDLSQESEGLRRFLAYLIALYQLPSRQTLIFEEPEKGIHPGALAVLAEQFTSCAEAGRGQVILTTHSPELLDHLPPESFRLVEMENYVTRIGPLDPNQIQSIRDQLIQPGELLTVASPRLAGASAE